MQEEFFSVLADKIADQVATKVMEKIEGRLSGAEKILYSMAEAGERMGLSRSTVKNMVRDREIAVVRRGSRVLIHRRDIEAWVLANRI